MTKVLLVDDDIETRELLGKILCRHITQESDLKEASCGEEALAQLAQEIPDLILLDIKLPDIDGFDLCRKIKNDPRTSMVPIIFITAMENLADKIKGFDAGAVEYITKPITAQETEIRLTNHLRIKQLEQEHVDAKALTVLKEMVVTYNHQMRQPLMVAYLSLGELMEKTDHGCENYIAMTQLKEELDRIKLILEKIRRLDQIKEVDYMHAIKMIQLDDEPTEQA